MYERLAEWWRRGLLRECGGVDDQPEERARDARDSRGAASERVRSASQQSACRGPRGVAVRLDASFVQRADAWSLHIVAGSGSTTPATSERTAACGDLHAVNHAACRLPPVRAGMPEPGVRAGAEHDRRVLRRTPKRGKRASISRHDQKQPAALPTARRPRVTADANPNIALEPSSSTAHQQKVG